MGKELKETKVDNSMKYPGEISRNLSFSHLNH